MRVVDYVEHASLVTGLGLQIHNNAGTFGDSGWLERDSGTSVYLQQEEIELRLVKVCDE
jgi:hypothetical protein